MSSKEWCLGQKINIDKVEPKYGNLKIEVLTNEFAKISKREWNDTLKKSKFIYQKQNFKYVLDLKQVIALKLYCDFEFLQCEYKKCFRSPHNQNQVRLQSFYHWNKILLSAIKKLSDSRVKFHHKLRFDDKKFKSVYHGVSSILDMKNIEISSNHIHKFYGPLSTTTDIFIARSFAGSKGMIIEIEFRGNGVDKQDITVPIDVTFFSTFPEEQEILCFDQSICIKNVMLSTEFDAKYLRDLPNN